MDEYDSCRPAFMKLDIKRKSYGPAMILGEEPWLSSLEFWWYLIERLNSKCISSVCTLQQYQEV